MPCRTDPSFFRLYDLDFLSGRPFSEKEFRQGERVCVITDKVAERIGDATHVSIDDSSGSHSFRVVGVVKTVSSLMENATADIYVPYSVKVGGYSDPDHCIDQVSYSGQLNVRLLLREGYSRQDFLDEIEPLRRQYNAVMNARLGKDWGEWRIDADTHFFKTLNFFNHSDGQDLAMKAKELTPPALLMLLFLLLPAINLSGLMSNRMEARRAEMGIRKAFGGKRRTLLNEVIHENLVLTLLGGIVGWLLSWLFITAVCNTEVVHKMFLDLSHVGNEPSLDFQMFFTPTLFLVAFACCAVLNLMAALIPAWHSLRKPIVESLNQKR
jgi:ABC-type antimicrobial peptide transport system, permease component